LAAALQQALETIVMHMLEHFQQATGHQQLALAGGVGQNSSMNGKIMQSGLFKQVFAPSFAADSGCAFGAAMYAAHQSQPTLPFKRIEHAYWGTPILAGDDLYQTLAKWQKFVSIDKMDNRADQVSDLMIAGKVIGWMQGRSEFGPRALGNRSIIADPRLGSHKETINAMIKMRESYRPFAPSVLEEYVRDFFEVPDDEQNFPFMSFVLPVKQAHREQLAAITHVDGSARLQTVSRSSNPEYWVLIDAFRKKTGVALLLNTSFNNHAEPIVDSADDAVVCYLTSGLDYLVVGDYLLTKRSWGEAELNTLIPALPKAARLIQEDCYRNNQQRSLQSYIEWNYGGSPRHIIPNTLHRILQLTDGVTPLGALVAKAGIMADTETGVYEPLLELWSSRFITFTP
jgi:carbamoyltransferase